MTRNFRTFGVYLLFFAIGSFQACSCEDTAENPNGDSGPDMSARADVGVDVSVEVDMRPDAQITDPCGVELNPCRDDEVCTAGADGLAACACPAGTHSEGQECVEDVTCAPTTCNQHGTCIDALEGPSCDCETGWTGDFCDACDEGNGWQSDGMGGCTDDPCTLITCDDKVCVVDEGVPTCVCPAGTHPQADICEPDRECLPNSCSMRGTCDDAGGVVSCECDMGFAGEACAECDAMGGFHDDGMGGCTTDSCLPNPCVEPNKGECTANGTAFSCACDVGYHDDGAGNCVIDEVCEVGSCSGNGTCDDTGGVVDCDCTTGYTGDACDSCDAALGYHLDGMGGCTTDPCLPNPCSLVANKTACVSQGAGYLCECDTGFHPDGMGGCTDDPCIPDLCAAMNQACRVTNDVAECFTPVCNDMNPCTDDTLVNGVCTYTNVADGSACSTTACQTGETCTAGTCGGGSVLVCDDANPCTDDVCDTVTGCTFTIDDTNTPDDGIACTDDVCAAGFESHTPSNANCDNLQYCDGDEICAPTDPMADANGCLTQNVPVAPADPGPCSYYGACDDITDTFPLLTRSAGSSCDDGVICTTGDTCNGVGQCRGTLAGDCGLPTSCGATIPFPGVINIPQATVNLTLTLGGMALPDTGNDGGSHVIYAVAKDTGVRHLLSNFYWDTYYTPDLRRFDTERLMPGVYDIMYRKGETSNDSGYVYRTDSSDIGPNGVRLLAEEVYVYAGSNDLTFDIPQTAVTVDITMGGLPLPDTGNDGGSHVLYAVSQDTGVRHLLSNFYWDTYYTPDLRRFDTERLMPGMYDILYRKGETSNDSGYVYRTDSSDIGPNGVHFLARDVEISGATTAIAVDIPQTAITLDITLNGAPLPDTGNDGGSHVLYAVNRENGVRHLLSNFYWDTYYTPDLRRFDTERLMPGAYDILYRKGETSNDSGYVYRTDSSDIGPNGVRLIAENVIVSGAAQTLNFDIPDATVTIDITLGGAPLPDTGNDGGSHVLYAVSKDTGVRHLISNFYWDTYYTPDLRRFDTERLMPGTYDILYRKGETSNDSGYVYRTDTSDIGPNGVRILATDVVVANGDTLAIDIPQTPISLEVTLGGAPLPDTGNDGGSHVLYAVSQDTGARHLLSNFYWDTYYTPDLRRFDTERLMPGTYDILYRKGETSNDSGYVYRTDSSDIGPNGVRILATDVVIAGNMSQLIAVDIPQTNVSFDVYLGGQSLPQSGNDGGSHVLYAVSRDTGTRHLLSNFYWDTYYTPDLRRFDTERLITGEYDILYRKGETSNDSGYVYRTDSSDIGPNGVRYLGYCLEVN